MQKSDRVYMMPLADGVSVTTALTAIAIAAYRLAPAVTDGDETHPEYREDDDLDPAEAVAHVRDDGVTMLFAKGRMPLLDVGVCGDTHRSVSVKFDLIFDGASEERVLGLAAEIMKDLGDPEIEVEVDLSELFPDLSDDLSEDRFRALGTLVHVET